MESVNLRNLEQIQEQESGFRPTRLGTLLLASLAGAALVTAFVVMAKKNAPPARSAHDPLAELVKNARTDAAAPEKLEGHEVTFPGLLSDDEKPTTALAAVKDERGRLVKQDDDTAPSSAPSEPPPATDRLPVVPLPVGTLLNATPVTSSPKDELTLWASSAAQIKDAELAPPGMEGGFQLQVASFKDPADADRLVEDLRKRGHRALRQAANVPERGIWHRVRIGPFRSKFEALKYKEKFERSERISPFVVDPDKVKQAEELRAARLAAQGKKRGVAAAVPSD
jgi:DedD protein